MIESHHKFIPTNVCCYVISVYLDDQKLSSLEVNMTQKNF